MFRRGGRIVDFILEEMSDGLQLVFFFLTKKRKTFCNKHLEGYWAALASHGTSRFGGTLVRHHFIELLLQRIY